MNDLLADMPHAQRLALSYAPPLLKGRLSSWFALDARLGQIIRQGREPMLVQMRLAWWRDRLGEDVCSRPTGDLVLNALQAWAGDEEALVDLVNGWEFLVTDGLGEQEIQGFANGRAAPWRRMVQNQGNDNENAGLVWALADLAAHLGNPAEREKVLALAEPVRKTESLPRELRALSVLEGLAMRSLRRGGRPLVDGPVAGLTALRIGMMGR